MLSLLTASVILIHKMVNINVYRFGAKHKGQHRSDQFSLLFVKIIGSRHAQSFVRNKLIFLFVKYVCRF